MSGQMVPKGYKHTEVGVIHENWNVLPISEIGEIIRGASPRPKGDKRYYGGNIPRLMVEDVTRDGKYVTPCVDFLTDEGAKLSRFCPKGTLTIVCSGTVGVTSFLDVDACIHDGFLALIKIKKCFLDDYLYHQLSSLQSKFDNSATHGGVFTNLTTDGVKRFRLPLPPTIGEQKLIARALSDIDALIEGLEGTIGKKRHIKQGAMQELLTGRRRLPGFSAQWEVKRFGELVAPRSERVDPRKSGVYNFCIELEHIGSGTGLLLGSTTTGNQSSLKSVFYQGDVLFGKLRAYLRKYWQADCSGVCSTEIWVLSPKDNLISTEYLFQIVQTDQFIETATLSYGTHMPRSDWSIVKNYELFSPSTIEEQTAIATILSDMDTEIATLEVKLTKTRQLKQGMMHELLTGRIRLVEEAQS